MNMFTFAGFMLLGYSIPNLAKELYLRFKKEKEVGVDDDNYPNADE